MRIRTLFLFLFTTIACSFLQPERCTAQVADEPGDTTSIVLPGDHPTDTDYVRLFPETFTVRTYLSEKFARFNLHDNRTGQDINYLPNVLTSLGVGVTLRGIGLNFSTRLPIQQTREEDYGRTRRYDLQIHRYRRKLAADIYLQRYKGFHLEDNSLVTRNDGPTTYPYFPNMRQLRFGATILHMPNGEHYSMRSALNQQEWQVRSAGSLLIGGSAYTQFIHNKGGLDVLPPNYRYPGSFGGRGIMQIENYSLGFNIGYGYNYVFRGSHWFLGAALDGGAGPAYSRVKTMDGQWETDFALNMTANVRLQGGYNSEKWFFGAFTIVHADRYGLPMDETNVTTAQGIARIVVARRFQPFKLGRKPAKPTEADGPDR